MSCNAFFHWVYRDSTSSQLSPTSTRSSAYSISFTTPSLISLVTSSITNANRRGLSIDPWWSPTFTSNGSDLVYSTLREVSIFVYISIIAFIFLSNTPFLLSDHQITSWLYKVLNRFCNKWLRAWLVKLFCGFCSKTSSELSETYETVKTQ